MAEEYSDIVDGNGNLTGEKELRSVVHKKGLWHRTVHIFLYKFEDDKLYFLAQQRSKTKDRHPNEWTIVSGDHVVSGASIEDAIKSELNEELGINSDSIIFIDAGVYPYISNTVANKEFVHMFFGNFKGDVNDMSFNDGEVQAVAWKERYIAQKEIRQFPDIWADSESKFELYMELFEKYVTKKETSL